MTRVRAPRPSRAAEGRRAGVGMAASTVFHLLVLAFLVLTLRKPAPPSLEPVMELSLVRPSALPTPARPRPVTAPPSTRFRPTPTTEPAPQAPVTPERAQPLERPPVVALPSRPPGDMIQFYQQHIPGCGREDLLLMKAEEQDACRARIAAAAAAAKRNMQAEDRKRAPFMGIDPAKRAEYEAALRGRRDRRDGSRGSALLEETFRDRRETNTDPDARGR